MSAAYRKTVIGKPLAIQGTAVLAIDGGDGQSGSGQICREVTPAIDAKRSSSS
jgi:hypothetical protein